MSAVNAVNLKHALLALILAVCLLLIFIADRAEITRRLRQAGLLLTGAGTWLASAVLHPWSLRGRTLTPPRSPRHPAGKALPGQHPVITYRERREFDAITGRLDMPADAKWPVSGEAS